MKKLFGVAIALALLSGTAEARIKKAINHEGHADNFRAKKNQLEVKELGTSKRTGNRAGNIENSEAEDKLNETKQYGRSETGDDTKYGTEIGADDVSAPAPPPPKKTTSTKRKTPK